MSKKSVVAIIASLLATIIFTFCLYNVFPPKVLILRYILSLIFYVVLTIVLYPFVKNKGLLFVIAFLPVFIIDGMTIFTGPSLMPLRFPFATIFPVAGILFGITILYRKRNLILIS